jgi:FKBP-type peptidyl-prolyl cis-trans isomerase (trigger factor)
MNTRIRVGSGRIVSIRYCMKNAAGELVVNNLQAEPVSFLFGSGDIFPGLEGPLKGLHIGERKSFSISPDTLPELQQTLFFDVIIDDIQWSQTAELQTEMPKGTCGPDCDC